MALLTKKQMNEIFDIHNATHAQFAHRLRVWNEKQTGVQVNVDWSKAPECAVSASIGLTWVNEKGLFALGYTLNKFDRPKPIITPHPHVEMIAKYAEVAQRRVDPWVEFEWCTSDTYWFSCDSWINFNPNNCYRHIGETK